MVQLLQVAVARELGDHVAGGEEQVVARRAGLQLGEHGLVGVEDVDHDLAVVLLFELLDQLGVDVVHPGEEMELGGFREAGAGGEQGGGGECQNAFLHGGFPCGPV